MNCLTASSSLTAQYSSSQAYAGHCAPRRLFPRQILSASGVHACFVPVRLQYRQAVAEGGKEIVLTGVNIGDFGETTHESFIDLVKALDKVDGVKRYRISSLEPDLIDDELIEYCAQSRAFMPHFHIPLQSGSDKVLQLMHRRYDKQLFAHKIHLIKQLMPDAFIGVDVMVGTRGETPELFEESYEFIWC